MPAGNEVVAGDTVSFSIEFKVGAYGIDDGGNIRVAWRLVSDFEAPQFDDPAGYGYTTVTTDGAAKVRPFVEPYERPFKSSIRIGVSNGFLKEGDTIRLTFGDTSKGSPGIRAQSFCESRHEFRVFSDPFGTMRFFECEERLAFSVVSAAPDTLQAVIPGTVKPGEDFDIVLRCLDKFGNPAKDFSGEVELAIPGLSEKEYDIVRQVRMTAENRGLIRIGGNHVFREGPFHLKVSCQSAGFLSYSNASFCGGPGEMNLYFGDMHGQNDLTIGTGSLDEYYSFARDAAAVDFSSWQGNDLEVDEDKWELIREKTREYHKDGKYVVFLGYEWSGTTPTGGDHNVYFLDDSEDYYPSSNALTLGKRIKPENNANPLPELYKKLAGRKDVMLVPHIGGRKANLDFFNPEFIHNIEIHSHHGIFEWFGMDAMKRRLKTGFLATSDDHTCRLGMSYPCYKYGKNAHTAFDVSSGLTGVYAKELTRQGIWEALTARRCYASTQGRVNLLVKMGSHYMGEEIPAGKLSDLYVRAAGSAPVDRILFYNWDQLLMEKRMLPPAKNRIRITWTGVVRRARQKSADWSGTLRLENGKILSAEAVCFDRIDQGITSRTDTELSWTSSTSGDIDGLELLLESSENTILHFHTQFKDINIPVREITAETMSFDAGGENLRVEISLASEVPPEESGYLKTCSVEVTLPVSPEIANTPAGLWVKTIFLD